MENKLTIYEVLKQTSDLYLSTLDEDTLKTDVAAIKRFRWFFLSSFPELNNLKITINTKE